MTTQTEDTVTTLLPAIEKAGQRDQNTRTQIADALMHMAKGWKVDFENDEERIKYLQTCINATVKHSMIGGPHLANFIVNNFNDSLRIEDGELIRTNKKGASFKPDFKKSTVKNWWRPPVKEESGKPDFDIDKAVKLLLAKAEKNNVDETAQLTALRTAITKLTNKGK